MGGGKLIDLKSDPSTRSELNVFAVPTTQVVFDSSRWLDIPTSTPLMNSGPYEFNITDSRSYLQMSRAHVYMRFRLENKVPESKKTETGAKAVEVGMINYAGATFFNQVKLEINNTQVYNCTNYAYKAYLEAVLNHSTDQKNGILQGAGFYEDDASGLDSSSNVGYKTRVQLAANGNVDLIAPLHIDHFTADRLLIPHLNIHLQLYRNSDEFVLESHDSISAGIPNYKLELVGMSLMVKAINVISSANLALEKTLLTTTAKYPYTRTRIKCLSVPGGRSDLPFSTIFTDIIPRRIVVGCVEQDAYDGNITKSPFNFKPFGISEVSIDAGGIVYPAQPFAASFSTNKYAKNFLMFYENIGAIGEHRQISIGYKKYKNGYSLFAFNLSPTDSNSDFELIRSGTTQIHMKFSERTPTSGLQIIIYAEYDGMYQIDHYRNIHADHET